RFDLEQFTPLLALPVLAKARAALEKDRPGAAATELEKVFSAEKSTLSADERHSWTFLLGRRREQAGELKPALVAYQAAAASDWALVNYAKLYSARLLTKARKPEDALLWLEKIKPEPPLADDLDLLIAEASMGAGKIDSAITHWTKHLQASERPVDRLNVALRLATALLARAEERPETAVEDRATALTWARRVRIENPRGDAQRATAERLEARALAELPADQRQQHAKLGLDLELVRVRALLDAGLDAAADEAAEAVLSQQPQ